MNDHVEQHGELSNNLLHANGIAQAPTDEDRQQMIVLLDRQERQQRRSKKLVTGMWIVVAALAVSCAILSFILVRHRTDGLSDTIMGVYIAAQVLLLASIYATIRHLITSRSLSNRQILYHLKRIEDELAASRTQGKSSP